MLELGLAAGIWIAVHVAIAGSPLRWIMVERMGEAGFRGLFSLFSAIALALLVQSYRIAPLIPLWHLPPLGIQALGVLMLPACIFLVGAVITPNPTLAGQEFMLERPAGAVQRITRHPMLWSFTIWAAVHMLARGDVAALVFFGSFAVTCLLGMRSIDAKLMRNRPVLFGRLRDETSIIPFAALLAGRTHLPASEFPLLVPALGFALWLGLIYLHPMVIGVIAMPG